MGIFDLLRGPDINEGVREYEATEGGFLLDVRSPQEYREGHIPGSRNIPLQSLDRVSRVVLDMSAPIFVYCLSGGRSRQAVSVLKGMGYSNVKNLGGISSYSGKVVR